MSSEESHISVEHVSELRKIGQINIKIGINRTV